MKQVLLFFQIMSSRKLLPGLIVIVLMMFFLVRCMFSSNDASSSSSKSPIDCAYTMSHDCVKAKLNFPTEVDFPFGPGTLKELSKDKFQIYGSVTSKNGFGVKITNSYMCELTYNGSGELFDPANWSCGDVAFLK